MSTDPTPASSDQEFSQLLARVRQGDESAAAELVKRYERTVLRFVRSRLGPGMRRAMDSIDVPQSVHQSLLLGLRNGRFQISSPQQLVGLAVVMVQRKVARQWRRLKRLPAASNRDPSSSQASPLDQVASREPGPLEAASASAFLEQVLSHLDELDRQLVRLKLDGHTSAEVAMHLGRDAAFVRMRWSRIRQKLRERGVVT